MRSRCKPRVAFKARHVRHPQPVRKGPRRTSGCSPVPALKVRSITKCSKPLSCRAKAEAYPCHCHEPCSCMQVPNRGSGRWLWAAERLWRLWVAEWLWFADGRAPHCLPPPLLVTPRAQASAAKGTAAAPHRLRLGPGGGPHAAASARCVTRLSLCLERHRRRCCDAALAAAVAPPPLLNAPRALEPLPRKAPPPIHVTSHARACRCQLSM